MTNQNGSLDHGYELPLETGTGDKNCEISFDMSKLTFDFAVSRPSLRAPKIGNQSFSSEITLFQLAVGSAAIPDGRGQARNWIDFSIAVSRGKMLISEATGSCRLKAETEKCDLPLSKLAFEFVQLHRPQSSLAHYLWAVLIALIYEVFPLVCPVCGGNMPIIAFITYPINRAPRIV